MMKLLASKWMFWGVVAVTIFCLCFSVTGQVFFRDGDATRVWAGSSSQNAIAIDRARASFPHFKEKLEQAEGPIDSFFVRVSLPSKNGVPEAVWLHSPVLAAENMSGIVAHVPAGALKNELDVGFRANFTFRNVTDWAYLDGEQYRGLFTTRTQPEFYSELQNGRFEGRVHPDPLPAREVSQ